MKNNKIALITIILVGILLISGISYAVWSIYFTQSSTNRITAKCFSTTFSEGNAITLTKTLPTTDEEGMKENPYTFTLNNTCDLAAEYQLNIEVLNDSTLSSEYVKIALDNQKSILSSNLEATPTIANANKSYTINNGLLLQGDSITFNLRSWLDINTTTEQGSNKTFKSKITIITKPIESNVELTNEFIYTGTFQEYVVPMNGYYEIELWGAEGTFYSGTANLTGLGGYTSGKIKLNKGEKLYFYLGEAGKKIGSASSFNAGTASSGGYPAGGATDVRIISGSWSDSISLRSRIMVAGGGGTAAGFKAGNGGNLIAGSCNSATGGTQTAGGVGASPFTAGVFGIGGNGHGGGGGYYGGGGGNTANCGSGGGSSYISGYAGSNSILETGGTTSAPIHSNNTIHYSGKYFINGIMKKGINKGNGKAKITYIRNTTPSKTNTKLNNVRYIKSCINGNSISVNNFWVELSAIKNGLNIAKNKLPVGTSPQYDSINNYNLITDGIVDKNLAGGRSLNSGLQCITIDLETTYDLDEIGLWLHWYDVGRIFYENTLSVGSTNVTGTSPLETILHTYSGTDGYIETSDGKRYTAWD